MYDLGLRRVTAVIPTRNRPELVCRAVESVLAQTHTNIEAVVVVDGPDEATLSALARFPHDRVCVVALTETVGGAKARNIGVELAHGEWIALLDDDDEWLAEKTTLQLQAALASGCTLPIVCSQVIARSANAEMIWPIHPPREPYSDYLLVRKRLSYGEGLMQTSTLMAKRELFLAQPFTNGLIKHQDWDWILRALQLQGVATVYVEQPLAIWYLENNAGRVSRVNRWRASLEWIEDVSPLITPLAYSSFIATYVAPQAADAKAYLSLAPLFLKLISRCIPRPRDFVVFFAAWVFPSNIRVLLRKLVHGRGERSTKVFPR